MACPPQNIRQDWLYIINCAITQIYMWWKYMWKQWNIKISLCHTLFNRTCPKSWSNNSQIKYGPIYTGCHKSQELLKVKTTYTWLCIYYLQHILFTLTLYFLSHWIRFLWILSNSLWFWTPYIKRRCITEYTDVLNNINDIYGALLVMTSLH